MIAKRFINEQDPRHGGRLHWPGHGGIPIRDDSPNLVLKREDYNKLALVADFQFYLFDLSKEKDQEYYKWVNDRIYAGLFSLIYKERIWGKEDQTPKIYMEWCQLYYELSGENQITPTNGQQDFIW